MLFVAEGDVNTSASTGVSVRGASVGGLCSGAIDPEVGGTKVCLLMF